MSSTRTWPEIKAEIESEFTHHPAAECEHPADNTFFRRKRLSNGGIQLRQQCLTCGAVLPQILPHSTVKATTFEKLPWVDEQLAERQSQQWQDRHAAKTEAMRRAFWEFYNSYLTSDAWREKRQLILNRARGDCEGCGTQRIDHIHHLTYKHLGDEFLFELVAVCETCHQRLHPDHLIGGYDD